jgi:hypothetical protein
MISGRPNSSCAGLGSDERETALARDRAGSAKRQGSYLNNISDGTMTYFDKKSSSHTGRANKAHIQATQEFRRVLEGWHLPAESTGQIPPGIGR